MSQHLMMPRLDSSRSFKNQKNKVNTTSSVSPVSMLPNHHANKILVLHISFLCGIADDAVGILD